MVGKPRARRGFKVGLVLRNGTIAEDVGGGLCQMTNMINWMAIHTDLKIVERWRHGSWRCDVKQHHKFEVFEKDHSIKQEYWGGYSRHNSIWRKRLDVHTSEILGEEFITDNHAIMMYEPLLPNPDKQK